MSLSSRSASPTQTRPRAFTRSSLDSSYFCMDLTSELEEASPVIQGCGAFSDVYKYKDRHANPPIFYAIKSFRTYYCNELNKEKAEKRIKREIESWRNLRHPNVLRLEGILYRLEGGFPCLVSPWMENGTARQYIKNTKGVDLLKFVSGIANGLSFMHQKTIAHGDLRGDNVLVSNSGQALICDFGLSKLVESLTEGQTVSSVFGYCATRYRAPEFVLPGSSGKPTPAGDVWMFGMTFLELWSGQKPFSSQNDAEVIIMLSKQQLPDVSDLASERSDFSVFKERVISICSLCWIMDPVTRLLMGTIAALMRILASEKDTDDSLSRDEMSEHSEHDSGIDISESLANLSVTDSPMLTQSSPAFVVNGDGFGSSRSGSGQPTDIVSQRTSSPFPKGPYASIRSSWSDLPKPPSPSFNDIFLMENKVFRQALNTYKQKYRVPVLYKCTNLGPDHILTWSITCTIGSEELGSALSAQKRDAEELSARMAVQRLTERDPGILSQCLSYLPILRTHLAQHGLTNRVQFQVNNCPPYGQAHIPTFTCEVIKDSVKACEGHGANKGDAQEQAAKNFATAWRDGLL